MDTVADFLTRIRNAKDACHDKVDVPSSNLRKGIATVLKDNGYIRNFKVVQDGRQGMMRIYLKYTKEGRCTFDILQRSSRPGKRFYVNVDKIPNVRQGYGMAILSTSKGVLSSEQARVEKVGGEVLCKVW